MKILVVEDEPKLNKNIVEGLKNRGHAVDCAFDVLGLLGHDHYLKTLYKCT